MTAFLRFLSRGLLPFVLLLLAACGDDDGDPNACTTDNECPGAETCVDGMCQVVADRPDAGSDAGEQDASLADVMTRDTSGDAGPPPLQEWILSIDNEDDFMVHRLVRISIAEANYGEVSVVCPDIALPETVPARNIISSLTFNSGRLYATGRGEEDGDLEGDALLLVDPCLCTATDLGRYAYSSVAGITSDGIQDMFGVSGADDVIFRIDPADAASTLLSALSSDWSTVGLTWSGAATDTLWGINGAADQLVEFDPEDGSEIRTVDLDFSFGSVGIEYHPGVDTIFACSNPGELLVVDPATGEVTIGPDLGLEDCNNLAAPFGAVECVL